MQTVDEAKSQPGTVRWRTVLLGILVFLLLLALLLWLLFSRDPCPASAMSERESAGLDMTTDQPAELYYLAGLVVGDPGPAVDGGDIELDLLDGGDLDLALQCTADDGTDTDTGAALAELVNVYRIDATLDPVTVSRQLDGLVSPIHVMAPAVHWSFEPGEDARPFFSFLGSDLGVQRSPVPPAMRNAAEVDHVIAVVDTGYVETGVGSIDDFVRWDEAIDEDVDGRGHGTFIASLIRQVAPTTQVSIARAQTVSLDEILRPAENADEETLSPDVAVTSELHVAEAIARLVARHDGEAVDALNLSLGTWTDQIGRRSALWKALESWWASRPGAASTVFAAAGNEFEGTEGLQFYPAALAGQPFPDLRAVQPTAHDGLPVYWTPTDQQRRGFDGHPWATDQMLGVDLLGVCGATAEECVPEGAAVSADGDVAQFASWSGASFATPIVAAVSVNGDGTVPDYANVAGLSYLPAPSDP